MNKTSIAGAIALSTIGLAVVAHNGATGVVLDRMNGMSAMRDVMRDLAPMMQGQVPYDMGAVQAGATTLLAHSGETMNALFPQEAEIPAASYARPAIWEDWARFAALSEELRTYATGLALAAPNGLSAPAPTVQGGMDGMAMDGMAMDGMAMDGMAMDGMAMPAPVTVAPEGFSVAELMGVAPAAPDRSTGASGVIAPGARMVPVESLVSVDFSAMAAPQVFEMIGQSCAACHAQFRNGS